MDLLTAGGIHEYLWMDSGWLRETWERAGVPLEIVDCGGGLTTESLTWLLAAILPPDVSIPVVRRDNPGLSAYGVDIWREHLRSSSPTYWAPAMRVLETFCAVDPWATDRRLGGRYELVRPLAKLLDAAFPSAACSVRSDAPAQATDQARQAGARRQLRDLLANDRPLTRRVGGDSPTAKSRRARARVGLSRRQRQDDLIWSLASLVRRAQGRRRPIKADWAFYTPGQQTTGATLDVNGGAFLS